MKEYNLNIAGYNIRIESPDFELTPGERFSGFRCFPHPPDAPGGGQGRPGGILRNAKTPPAPPGGEDTLRLSVVSGTTGIPRGAERVFHAPYVEEIDGSRYQKDPEFWSVWRNGDNLFIKTTFPRSAENKNALLKFTTGSKEWELYLEGEIKTIDPLEYPLDGLILYYLTVLSGDIMIHASGINHEGKGYIFSGVSGKGKTTMSRLWSDAGAEIIHDDRLIIRRTEGLFRIYNTPVYDNEQPWQSPLHRIYIIEHAEKNSSVLVKGAAAVSLVMANCIQQNWGPEIIAGLLGSVSAMCEEIPVFRLGFIPDRSIIDHITKNE